MSALKTVVVVVGAVAVVSAGFYVADKLEERARKRRVRAFTRGIEELTDEIFRTAGFTDKHTTRTLLDLCL
jgi:hypothetical protein